MLAEAVATEAKPLETQTIAPGAPNYYPWFDWLRLALATIVLFGHEALLTWRNAGNFCVQIFFALSGWLIGNQLVSLSRCDLPRFYFNRALRIWAPYFLAVTLIVLASLAHEPITSKWLEIVFYDYTSVFNLFGQPQMALQRLMPLDGTGGHFWSVNAEEQFYLLAPLVLVLLPSRFGRSLSTWACIAATAWIARCYASIAFGVLAAVAAERFGEYQTRWFCRILLVTTLGACVAAFGLHVEYDLVAPICAVTIVLLLAVRGRRIPGGELAAGMSYPLYLNAWIAVFAVNALFKRLALTSRVAHEILVVVLSLILAGLFYWFYDRPILARKRSLFSPKRAQATIYVAYGTVAIGIVGGLILFGWR